MKSEQLEQVREACKQQLLDELMTLVKENGEDYNDYFYDEHGIVTDEGYTVTKVFDISLFGCHIGLPLKWCDDFEGDTDPTPEQLVDEYVYHDYWSLYIERDDTGYETLMIYQFCNPGVNRHGELADPSYSTASEMSLAELDFLTEAIYWHLRRDVEKKNNEKPLITAMAKKYQIELQCDEWWVADSLQELGTMIECGDLQDQMQDGRIQVNGEHYTAEIKETNK